MPSPKCMTCKVKESSFGLPGGKRKYCFKCKSKDMVNLKSLKCIKCNIKYPNFGYPFGKIHYCNDCKYVKQS